MIREIEMAANFVPVCARGLRELACFANHSERR